MVPQKRQATIFKKNVYHQFVINYWRLNSGHLLWYAAVTPFSTTGIAQAQLAKFQRHSSTTALQDYPLPFGASDFSRIERNSKAPMFFGRSLKSSKEFSGSSRGLLIEIRIQSCLKNDLSIVSACCHDVAIPGCAALTNSTPASPDHSTRVPGNKEHHACSQVDPYITRLTNTI